MINLYEEIVNNLKQCNQKITDIEWISINEKSIPIYDFLNIAKKTNYNSGYGRTYINESIIIKTYGGFILTRHDYDGAEWFDIIDTNTPPKGEISNKDIWV